MNNPKRILGIDIGERRTGAAITDLTGTIAGGLEVIKEGGFNNCAFKVIALAEKHDVCEIVLGYPVNMNGSKGPKAKEAEQFKKKLEELIKEKKLEIGVVLFDERLSTSLAHVYMNETGIKSKDRKQKIDMLSAQIILQNYIDSKRK